MSLKCFGEVDNQVVKALTSKEDVHTLVSEISVWYDEFTVADPAIERIPEPLEGWGGKSSNGMR